MSKFTLEFLKAVNEWQRGGDARRKHYIGERIKHLSASLPDKFTQCNLVVYRRLALKKGSLWELIADGQLKESISAWTVDFAVAKNLKNGVPKAGIQGVILSKSPISGAYKVILNLSTLYADDEFLTQAHDMRGQIAGYEYGIGQFGASQSEVIIETPKISATDIYSLGGYSSDFETILKLVFGIRYSASDRLWLRNFLAQQKIGLGACWIDGESKDRVIQNLVVRIPELKARKAEQDAAKKHHKKRKSP